MNDLRLTDSQFARAAWLWSAGADTFEIAHRLNLAENLIYNLLNALKASAASLPRTLRQEQARLAAIASIQHRPSTPRYGKTCNAENITCDRDHADPS